MRGAKPKNRMAECHPTRAHHGRGKCKQCAQLEWWHSDERKNPKPKREGALTKSDRDAQPGLVRNIPAGWGALR